MWDWFSDTGELYRNGQFVARGYAGNGQGKNNPAMQSVMDVGPLPVGRYTIEEPYRSLTHGPYAMRLTPDPANQMFGRAGFMVHGDNRDNPGTASDGCIVLDRITREDMWESGDHTLEVLVHTVLPDIDGEITA